MKKIISLFSVVIVAVAFAGRVLAQDFEGTVIWKMKAEMTDPKLQAQMEQAQAQLASPEMQAKMEQARAALSSPQMQEMMKQNPAMRAMIEKQLAKLPKPAATGNGPGGMFPHQFVCKMKGLRALIAVEGGMFPMETLTLGDKGAAYRIDRAQHTYRRIDTTMKMPEGKDAPQTPFKVTPTSEKAKIAGYDCTRYDIEQTGSRGPVMHYTVWATKDIKGFDIKKLEAMRVGRDAGPNFMTQVDGVPLKVEINTPQAKMVMQAESVTRESLPASTFELPAGFTEEQM